METPGLKLSTTNQVEDKCCGDPGRDTDTKNYTCFVILCVEDTNSLLKDLQKNS
jgi:hypothetical protein